MKNVCFFVYALLLVGIAAVSLSLTRREFYFTLDDPYIHLSLAENLRSGSYGVNAGEAASASSSIVWPILLLPFSGSSSVYWAFFLNIMGGGMALLACSRILHSPSASPEWLHSLLLILLIPSLNLVGLAFTGMEHSLHVAVTLWILLGCIQVADGIKPARWLWALLWLGPLLRYEGLAITLPALGFLGWRGYWRSAAISFAAVLASLLLYSFFLLRIGLDPLPSSVLVKSDAAANGVPGVFHSLKDNLLDRRGVLMSLGALYLVSFPFFSRQALAWRGLSFTAGCMVAMHLCVGRFGWYNRYEIYAWSVVCLMLLRQFLPHMQAWLGMARPSKWAPIFLGAWLTCISLFLVPQYWVNLSTIPLAARNLHRQQSVMRRLVLEVIQRPVAVNDLGLLSWENPQYVLDLWGLGNREARQARLLSPGSPWMGELASEHAVEAALIYAQWFPAIPASWVPVAELSQTGPIIVAGGRVVTLYALTDGMEKHLRQTLPAFASTLPSGASLRVLPPTVP